MWPKKGHTLCHGPGGLRRHSEGSSAGSQGYTICQLLFACFQMPAFLCAAERAAL